MFGVLLTLLFVTCPRICDGLYEDERMEEYRHRNHTWPPKPEEYLPNTAGWRALNERRLTQIDQLQGERYQGYMLAMQSALVMKNFTEYGWAVTRAPKPVIGKLKKRLHDGMTADWVSKEHKIACVETTDDDSLPFFVDDRKMNLEILHELLPLHEAWAGVELVPNNAYGLRVYRNGTNLNMHLDKHTTHIISSILHVDHGKSDEPWPIVIEDFHGNTNEVFLESGDMLFYESSKLFHGRPMKMKGEYYSSLFSHYYPKVWDPDANEMNVHYRIPEHWNTAQERDGDVEELSLFGTSVKELECEHSWCGLKNSLKWHGPGPGYGKVLTGGGRISTLVNIPTEDSFEIKNIDPKEPHTDKRVTDRAGKITSIPNENDYIYQYDTGIDEQEDYEL